MSAPFPFDDLPDTVLVDAMTRLPLTELVKLDQVSTRWRRLQAAALARAVTLTILVGGSPMFFVELSRFNLKYTEWMDTDRVQSLGIRPFDSKCSLKFARLDQADLDWLTRSMPNVRKLYLVYSQVDQTGSMHQVTYFLNHWRHSLKHLTLVYACGDQMLSPGTSTQLFETVNKLQLLRHLHMEIWNEIPGGPLDLPILARLNKFHFYSSKSKMIQLIESLRRYGLNNASLELVIPVYQEEVFLPQDKRLCAKVCRMFVEDVDDDDDDEDDDVELPDDGPVDQVDLTCSKFRALKYFRIKVREQTAAQLTRELAKLSQLVYLELDIILQHQLWDTDSWKARDGTLVLKDRAQPEGPQLSSVQVLRITMFSTYHHEDLTHAFNFGYTFPNLRMVEVTEQDFNECATCRLQNRLPIVTTIRDGWTRVNTRPVSCLHLMMAPFKDCKLLRMLIHIQPIQHDIEKKITDLSCLFK